MEETKETQITKMYSITRKVLCKTGKYEMKTYEISQAQIDLIDVLSKARRMDKKTGSKKFGVLNDKSFRERFLSSYLEQDNQYLAEQVGSFFGKEKNKLMEWMKYHGLIENEDYVVIDKKQFKAILPEYKEIYKEIQCPNGNDIDNSLKITDFLGYNEVISDINNNQFKPLLVAQTGIKKLMMISDPDTRNYFIDMESIMFQVIKFVNNEHRQQIEELKEEIKQQETTKTELESKLKNSRKVNQKLKKTQETKDKENVELKNEIEQKTEENIGLKTLMTQIENDKNELQKQIDQVIKEHNEKQEKIDTLTFQNFALDLELESKQKQYDSTLNQMQTYVKLIERKTFSPECWQRILIMEKQRISYRYRSEQNIVYLFLIYDKRTGEIIFMKIGLTTVGRIYNRQDEILNEIQSKVEDKTLGMRLVGYMPISDRKYENMIHEQIKTVFKPIQGNEYYAPNDTVFDMFEQFKLSFEEMYLIQEDNEHRMKEFIQNEMKEQKLEFKLDKEEWKKDMKKEQERVDKRQYQIDRERQQFEAQKQQQYEQFEAQKQQFETYRLEQNQFIQQQQSQYFIQNQTIQNQAQTIANLCQDRGQFITVLINNIQDMNPKSHKAVLTYMDQLSAQLQVVQTPVLQIQQAPQ